MRSRHFPELFQRGCIQDATTEMSQGRYIFLNLPCQTPHKKTLRKCPCENTAGRSPSRRIRGELFGAPRDPENRSSSLRLETARLCPKVTNSTSPLINPLYLLCSNCTKTKIVQKRSYTTLPGRTCLTISWSGDSQNLLVRARNNPEYIYTSVFGQIKQSRYKILITSEVRMGRYIYIF